MTNVNISAKGRAFLKKRASAKIAQAIVREGDRLSTTGALTVYTKGGKSITVTAVGSATTR